MPKFNSNHKLTQNSQQCISVCLHFLLVCACARVSTLISSFTAESIHYSSRCPLFRWLSLTLNPLESEGKKLCPYLQSKWRTWPEDWCTSNMGCPINRAIIFLFASCKTWKELFIWCLAFRLPPSWATLPRATLILNYGRDVIKFYMETVRST